ncbi:ABC transporter permease [Mizugakiibacter sediminis]|uniref:ABC transporter permease n=1 Tax=Mizugakiibacter sediminis TaxID=1475481 RepID=A0A0K8QIZ7_9GAMM|nr:ABC transporter permease [Mizugakiibacter sediminis]GAP64799.1 ABC transporter permease [Mizugakiibacter sediminis]
MSARAVARLELKRLAVRPFAWTLAALALAFLAWQFLQLLDGFLKVQTRLAAQADAPGYTDLVAVPLLAAAAQLLLVATPLLTMHALAGERRARTLPLLFACGQSPRAIVLGKYLGVLPWLAGILLLAAAMPLALAPATHLDGGKFAAALLGVALLTATLAAIGVACSAYASHPALAAAAAFALTLALWAIDAGARAQGVDNGAINYLAMATHVQPLLRGLVASVDLLYFALAIALALALATHRLAAERVRG